MSGVAFDVQMRRAVAKINADVGLVMQTAADELVADIRARTPVDTGRLQAGWEVIPAGPLQAVVANEVEYAEHVEFGTAYMAPRAMARTAMADWQRIVDRAVRALA